MYDTGVPGILTGTPKLADYGFFAVDEIEIAPDAAGNMNIVSAHEVAMTLFYVDELATDLWASSMPPSTATPIRHRGMHREPEHGQGVPGGGLHPLQRRGQQPGRPISAAVRVRADHRSWQQRRRGSLRQLPVPEEADRRHARGPALGIVRDAPDAACRASGSSNWTRRRSRSPSKKGSSGRRDCRCGSRRSSRPQPSSRRSSAWPTTSGTDVHDVPALAPQPAVHAGGPDVQRRGVLVPDPRSSGGRGHRGHPDARPR